MVPQCRSRGCRGVDRANLWTTGPGDQGRFLTRATPSGENTPSTPAKSTGQRVCPRQKVRLQLGSSAQRVCPRQKVRSRSGPVRPEGVSSPVRSWRPGPQPFFFSAARVSSRTVPTSRAIVVREKGCLWRRGSVGGGRPRDARREENCASSSGCTTDGPGWHSSVLLTGQEDNIGKGLPGARRPVRGRRRKGHLRAT